MHSKCAFATFLCVNKSNEEINSVIKTANKDFPSLFFYIVRVLFRLVELLYLFNSSTLAFQTDFESFVEREIRVKVSQKFPKDGDPNGFNFKLINFD